MREDDSADEGILSEAFSEYQEEHEHTAISEKHNSEFYDFIRIDDHHLCSSERVGSEEDPQRRPHRSEREERSIPREPISEEDSQDDPLLRLQSQRRRRRGSLRRNSRIQSRYKVEYEEDGTFLVPPVEKSRSWKDRLLRGCRATRKSPRLLHRKVISYKLSDLFGTEVSDQEEGRHRDERDGQVDRDEYGNRDGHRDRDEYRDRDGRRDRDEGYDRPLTNADQNVGPSSLIERIADIRKLKEMIVFPLLYPEVFTNLGISPPRGVIFQGPPGTGKTLLARLLAENCSVPGGSGRKVSFFMKNGSDCLSKWVGEAERNLRDLFNKARQQQPSIIFFDEIDGLAPERNGRQDQSHNSLVATLLALMDGLDDRGNVVVIGATNRVNSIDPALRRPGRFDREFTFELPNKDTRRDILKIHTATWKPHPSDCLLEKLSQETTDFSGADLKALCVEASLRAMRRACPRAYDLHLPPPDPTEISSCLTFLEVTEKDFEDAFCDIIPSICRGKRTTRPLTGPLELLLNPVVDNISSNIRLASLAQTGNGDSWMDGKSISFIESVQVYHFADKWTIHTSFLPRIVAALSKCLLQMRVVALYALDLIGRPRDLLLTHLHGLLPSSGGVLIMCDLGSLFENDLYDDLRSILVHFIRDSFYPGGAHLLVLLNSQSWDCDTLVTDAIEEHVSKFELDPPQLSFKEYCSEWARRLVLSEVIVKPLINWSSTASAIDVAKIESLMLQIGKELANLYENDPTRTTIVKDLIRRYIDGEETNDDLSDTIGTGL